MVTLWPFTIASFHPALIALLDIEQLFSYSLLLAPIALSDKYREGFVMAEWMMSSEAEDLMSSDEEDLMSGDEEDLMEENEVYVEDVSATCIADGAQNINIRLISQQTLLPSQREDLRKVNGDDYMPELALDSREQEAVYKVLEAINSDIGWRGLLPDSLCTGGPHDVICNLDAHDSKRHIVELNLGWVFDTANNPSYGRNASFSPYLVSIPRLRKLFFYRRFMHKILTVAAFVWVQCIRCSLSSGVIGLKDSFCSLRPARF